MKKANKNFLKIIVSKVLHHLLLDSIHSVHLLLSETYYYRDYINIAEIHEELRL